MRVLTGIADPTAVLIQTANDANNSLTPFEIRASTINFGGGQVGIGTATPQALLDVYGTGAMVIPRGTTAEQPLSAVNGMIRYNSEEGKFEGYSDGVWINLSGGSSSSGDTPGYYSSITYTTSDAGVPRPSCTNPTESTMNDESVAGKTTWGSSGSDEDTWIRADLGSAKPVSRIRVGGLGPESCWDDASEAWESSAYIEVQVSTDGSSWTTVADNTSFTYSDSMMKNIDFTEVSARYVRLYAENNPLATGQFRIYGSQGGGSGGGLVATQTIGAGGTITANACGGIKRITATAARTTSTSNTFTAPAGANAGCCMDVINVGSFNITLDNNSNFYSAGAANVVLGARDTVRVCSDGTAWTQIGATGNN
ncbi:MAG TPA: discoidin domain-containing protein [Bdellovibrionales bacterium]|nr:discoidin domain-containing protein [Bdellovibrionales bacterium]